MDRPAGAAERGTLAGPPGRPGAADTRPLSASWKREPATAATLRHPSAVPTADPATLARRRPPRGRAPRSLRDDRRGHGTDLHALACGLVERVGSRGSRDLSDSEVCSGIALGAVELARSVVGRGGRLGG